MAKSATARDRWTVRDVPLELQRRAKAAADRAGMKLGAWVSDAIENALDTNAASRDSRRIPGKSAQITEIEQRLARLERAAVKRKAPDAKRQTKAGAVPAAVDMDTPEFQALVKRLFIERLQGAPPQKIRDALSVSEEVAQLLSEVRA